MRIQIDGSNYGKGFKGFRSIIPRRRFSRNSGTGSYFVLQGVFDVFGGRLWQFIPFAVVIVLVFYVFRRILQLIKDQQTKYLSLIFDLISKVEREEPIPSLNELEKNVDKKNQLI